MDTLILGGDARMSALAALLGKESLYVDDPQTARKLLPEARHVVTNNPPKISLTLEAVRNLTSPEAKICLCGPKYYKGDDPRVIDLWTDEALLRENARYTAEGALSAAMRASQRSLKDLPCAVIGWGRIGSALTELLVALGVRVTVISRTPAHRNRAIERGADPAKAEDVVRKADKQRASYNKFFTQKEWGEPKNYHLMLNTSALGYEGAAEAIIAVLNAK